jgi:hypothetical protein
VTKTPYCDKDCSRLPNNGVSGVRHNHTLGCRDRSLLAKRSAAREFQKERKNHIRSFWPNAGGKRDTNLKLGRLVETKIPALLRRQGFTDVISTRMFGSTFSGDFVAKKNGEPVLVEVTCWWTHDIRTHKEFCRYFGLSLVVAFTNPVLQKAILKTYNNPTDSKSNAILHQEDLLKAIDCVF